MTLIVSISGIRGTIGGQIGEALTPIDTVKFVAAYGTWLKENNQNKKTTVVIGRDARISGEMIAKLTSATLISIGIDVIDLKLSTTPTVEIAVAKENAQGGIIITASHNPKNWNALKLLNKYGEFISEKQGQKIVEIVQNEQFKFETVENIGEISNNNTYLQKHINDILQLPLVDTKAIQKAKFSIVIDAINSSGGIFVATLLKKLGIQQVKVINEIANGNFNHNPEPLPKHLTELAKKVVENKANIGIAVDPDVDRLALICEDGTSFGEEYTLVAVADYILKNTPGPTVSNLSSTRALKDITEKYKQSYTASAVGEVNVVKKMKETKAVIGGEGNGGIIYPELHYGRDALVGIALFLSHLAQKNVKMSVLRESYPKYVISKEKIELQKEINTEAILQKIEESYSKQQIDKTDGLKINFENEWIHIRKSNTEPIIRIYAESNTKEKAQKLTQQIIKQIQKLTAV